MTDLPPEVEKALMDIEGCAIDYECEDGCCVGRIYNHLDESDLLRRHITAQAEEIERLREAVPPDTLCSREYIAVLRQRDRYKAMAEWLAGRMEKDLAQAEYPDGRPYPDAAFYLKAAEEATSDE